MRTILISILTSVVLLAGCGEQSKYVGEWKGVSKDGTATDLVLDPDKYALMKVNDQSIGGSNFIIKGKKAEMKYEIDETKEPDWIDLVVLEKGSSNEISRVKGIVKFLSADRIELRMAYNGERHTAFDSSDAATTMQLDRVKK